jgi:hypothetical protein
MIMTVWAVVVGRNRFIAPFSKASFRPMGSSGPCQMIGPMPGTVISRSQPLS